MVDRELRLRVLSALVMLPAAVWAIYLGGYWLALLAWVVGLLGVSEWLKLEGPMGWHTITTVAISLATAIYFMASGVLFSALTALIVGTLFVAVIRKIKGRIFIWPASGLLYIGISVLGLLWLRDVHGYQAVIWMFLIVWGMDTGAYFAGSLIGGPKLVPTLSPKKTWSGLIGGVVVATALSTYYGLIAELNQIEILAVVGVMLALWSQVGDIVESSLKRRFAVKDSGSLIPGHGGVLDRIDSIIFTVPLVVVMLMLWPGLVVVNG